MDDHNDQLSVPDYEADGVPEDDSAEPDDLDHPEFDPSLIDDDQ